MKQKILLGIGILSVLIILASCTPGGGQNVGGGIGGNGLTLSWVPNVPPLQLYDDQQFEADVELTNNGAYTIGTSLDRIYISGFSRERITGSFTTDNNYTRRTNKNSQRRKRRHHLQREHSIPQHSKLLHDTTHCHRVLRVRYGSRREHLHRPSTIHDEQKSKKLHGRNNNARKPRSTSKSFERHRRIITRKNENNNINL